MLSIIMDIAIVLGILLILVLVAAWVVGTKQPFYRIHKLGKVLFVSIRSTKSAEDRSSQIAQLDPLWHRAEAYPFIGMAESYWTDFVLLRPDSPAFEAIQKLDGIEDIAIFEVTTSNFPAIIFGIMRGAHLIGLRKKPTGTLPGADGMYDEVLNFAGEGGNIEVLPTKAALEATFAAPHSHETSMVNYLAYNDINGKGINEGRRIYRLYGREAARATSQVGAKFLLSGEVTKVLVEAKDGAETAGHWDDMAILVYPDPTAILYMEQIEKYVASGRWRDEGLSRSVVIAAAKDMSGA